MLSAANENVLMAIDGLRFDRVAATVSRIAARTVPALDHEPVRVHVEMLRREGYVQAFDSLEGREYELTRRGQDEAQAVALKASR